MFSLLIVEDNVQIREQLREMVKKLGLVKVTLASTAKEAVHSVHMNTPDVIFCDIHLPDSNGITLAEQLHLQYPNIGVVFITGYSEFAHKAFEIDAIDYLMKPFSSNRFRECIKKVYSFLHKEKKETMSSANKLLAVKVNSGVELLEQKDIAYINSEGKFSIIKTISGKNKKIQTNESLKSLEIKLDPDMFIRTHRSFVINLNHISRIEPSGQTNLIYFKSCTDIAYLSKNYIINLYQKLNYK
jgi:DNA-binding LytR/AlgR family response regulator